MSAKFLYIAFSLLVLAEIGVWTEPTITPIHQLVMTPGTIVRGTFPHPLVGCKVRISEHRGSRFDKVVDFSARQNSKQVTLYEIGVYSVTASFVAQSPNECGVGIGTIIGLTYPLLVEIFGQSAGEDWSRGWALVAISPKPVLHSTSPTPRLTTTTPGSDVSMFVKTQGALDGCEISTPAEGRVDLSLSKSPPPGSRYRLHRAGMANGECGFTLTNLTRRDSTGVWWWYGWQGESRAYQMMLVLVTSAPVDKPVLSMHNAPRLRVGDLMVATCRAPPSVPPPKLTWLLDGNVLRHDDGNATLPGDVAKSLPWQPQGAVQTYTRRLSSQDIGKRLECRAEHSAGNNSEVLVLAPLHLMVTAESPLIRSAVGHLVELACIVDAKPVANVQWYRAGVSINPSRFVDIGNDGTRHWLQLEDITRAEMTNFTCTASNELGSESKGIQLTGLPGEPRWKEGTSPPQLAWNVETTEELTSCKLKIRRGKARSQEHEVIDGVRRINDTWVLVQHHLQVAVAGNYSAYLIVRNVHGESPPSSSYKFALDAISVTSWPTSAPAFRTGCPALASPSLSAQCTLAGKVVDCSVGPVPLGTNARLQCLDGSRPVEDQHGEQNTTCFVRGWRPKPLACVPDCGFRRHAATPRSIGGEESIEGEFPWHVAVFRKKLDSFEPICGGSLITRRFFASAAHCFWDETTKTLMDVSLYNAVVGKHSLSWETRDTHEQRLGIKAIHIPDLYAGSSKRLEADIAVVQLSAPVKITDETNVVCMDWTTQTEYQQLTINSYGTVPGWGLTENDTMSPTLRHVDLPYVSYLTCKDAVPDYYKNYLLGDKMCGGFHNRTTGVCQGDSGGGFVFPAHRTAGMRYILRGVVSSGPKRFGPVLTLCWAEHFTAFTAVSSYVSWMKRIVFSDADDEGR